MISVSYIYMCFVPLVYKILWNIFFYKPKIRVQIVSFLKLQTLFSDLFLHLGYCCSHQCHFKECSWWQVKTKLEKISTIIPSPCHCYFGVWGHQFCCRAVRFTSSAQPPCDLSSQCPSTGCFAGMCSWGKKIRSLHCWSSCCIPSKGKQIFLFTSDASFSLWVLWKLWVQ